MKKPIVILWFLFALVVLAVIFFGRHRAARSAALPSASTPTTAAAPSGPSSTAAPKTTVAIQDGKTLDFSSGKPVLKDSADEKAIIAQSVKEMDEAAAGVTFAPATKAADAGAKKPTPQE